MVRIERDRGGGKRVKVKEKYKEMIRGRQSKRDVGFGRKGVKATLERETREGSGVKNSRRDKLEKEEARTTLKRWKRLPVC